MALFNCYCTNCKKFTPTNFFAGSNGKCKICKSNIESRYKDSYQYYDHHRNDYDFHLKEKNYEQIQDELNKIALQSDEKKKALKDSIVSSDTIPGKIVVMNLGMVTGTDNYNPAGLLGEGYLGSVGNVLMDAAIKKATERMVDAAHLKGANAIISFKTATSQAALNTIVVTVTGTAVIVEDGVEDSTEQKNSVADEIMKFKQLFDAGVLSEEEFNTKKKQLLGL